MEDMTQEGNDLGNMRIEGQRYEGLIGDIDMRQEDMTRRRKYARAEKGGELLITVRSEARQMIGGYLCVVWPKAIPEPPGSPRTAVCSRTL